jgi:hypothetical protein
MRPQLFAGGLFALVTGGIFYFTLFLYISVPLAVGGALMMAASFFLSEGPGPIAPPPGFKFCIYCATPVTLDSNRCPHCNGLQPKGA